MGKRIEMNPGELFMVADRMILVDEYESVLGDMFKIGSPEHQGAYIFTFSGKVNNRDDRDQVTVAMDLQSAWELVGHMLNGFELLKEVKEIKDEEGK